MRPSDVTLAEWIRHCKRAGLYEQGKVLYKKGGLNFNSLSEEAMVGVEEDYQVCVRMLARGAGQQSPKRGGRWKHVSLNKLRYINRFCPDSAFADVGIFIPR